MEFELVKLDFLRIDAKIKRRMKSKTPYFSDGVHYSNEYPAVENQEGNFKE